MVEDTGEGKGWETFMSRDCSREGSGMDRCVEKGRSTGREGEKSGEAKRGVGGGAPSCWAGVHTG